MTSNETPILWVLTAAWFFGLLAVDIALSRRRTGVISLSRAVSRSVIWIGLGILFGGFIWLYLGAEAGTQYFTGFIIEKSLSVDNIFVWSALFAYLQIPRQLQYTVLFWGIIGAIVFRTVFMIGGVVIIDKFQFMLIILGCLLIYTAYTIYADDESKKFNPEDSRVIAFLRRYMSVSDKLHDRKLFVKEHGKKVATYLFFAICTIELTDILFAVDSVPTVIAVVRDPYIALSSNIAAILGLRALYFVFDSLKQSFWLLNKGLAIILGVVGILLLLEPKRIFGLDWIGLEPPVYAMLIFITVVLVASVLGSIYIKEPKHHKTPRIT